MNRFYVDLNISGDSITIKDTDQIKQITKVLRLSVGDRLLVFNDTGFEWDSEITSVDKYNLDLKLLEKKKGIGFTSNITLYIALLKKDNLPLVLQKATELGVRRIVPINTERCVKNDISDAQQERLMKIIIEAAEQSEGALLPKLNTFMKFEDAVKQISTDELSLIAYARERHQTLEGLDLNNAINLFIGPEGGFTDKELKLASEYGIISLSLGERILRAETAAIATLGRLIIQ